MKEITSLEKAEQIAHLAAEKKGEDIVLMDMRTVSLMCDWFVLVSANSSRMLNAVSNEIVRKLSKEKIWPKSIEGKNNPYWVLLDYEDVIVHIFHREIRDFYGLERLWSDLPGKKFNNKCLAKTSRKE